MYLPFNITLTVILIVFFFIQEMQSLRKSKFFWKKIDNLVLLTTLHPSLLPLSPPLRLDRPLYQTMKGRSLVMKGLNSLCNLMRGYVISQPRTACSRARTAFPSLLLVFFALVNGINCLIYIYIYFMRFLSVLKIGLCECSPSYRILWTGFEVKTLEYNIIVGVCRYRNWDRN